MATILIKQTDGTYVPTPVDLYDAVFKGIDYSGTGTFVAFSTAVDDASAVLAFIHDNEAPEQANHSMRQRGRYGSGALVVSSYPDTAVTSAQILKLRKELLN